MAWSAHAHADHPIRSDAHRRASAGRSRRAPRARDARPVYQAPAGSRDPVDKVDIRVAVNKPIASPELASAVPAGVKDDAPAKERNPAWREAPLAQTRPVYERPGSRLNIVI